MLDTTTKNESENKKNQGFKFDPCFNTEFTQIVINIFVIYYTLSTKKLFCDIFDLTINHLLLKGSLLV